MSVNISTRQLQQPGFVDEVIEIVRASGADPGAIALEMTETGMLQDIPDTLAKLRRLRDAGLGISVDDFGTGYSSLSYLQRFPVTALKIARDFVHVDESEPDSWELASAIVSMGNALHLEVVAEGVEHLYQLNRLRDLGCGFAQGYYLARPSPADRIDAPAGSLGRGAGPALARRAARHIGRARTTDGASDGLSPLSRRTDSGPGRIRRYVANGTRTGTFGPSPHGDCQRLRSSPEVGDHARSPPSRPANTANPSKGGDAKPGIFGKTPRRAFHRPPGCQAPTTRKVAESVLDRCGSAAWPRSRRARRELPFDDLAFGWSLDFTRHASARGRGPRSWHSPSRSLGQAAFAATTTGRRLRRPPATRTRCTTSTLPSAPQDWWAAGYTGQGVDVALIDTGCTPGPGSRRARASSSYGPDLSLESQAPNLARPRHERPWHVHGRSHRRQRHGVGAANRGPGDLPRDGARRPHPLRQGRRWPTAAWTSRRSSRRSTGSSSTSIDNGLNIRDPQPLVRHELDPALHRRSARVRGRAGLEARHRGRRRGRQLGLPEGQGRAGARIAGLRPVRHRGRRDVALERRDGQGKGKDRTSGSRWRRSRPAAPAAVAAATPTSSRRARTSRASGSPDRSSTSRPRRRPRCPLPARQRHVGVGGDRVGRGRARAAEAPRPRRPTRSRSS